MGGIFSKLFHPIRTVSEYVQTDEIAEPRRKAGLQTPNIRILLDSSLDPRSITKEIKRTPLMLMERENENVNEDTPKAAPYLETDMDNIPDRSGWVTIMIHRGNKSVKINHSTPKENEEISSPEIIPKNTIQNVLVYSDEDEFTDSEGIQMSNEFFPRAKIEQDGTESSNSSFTLYDESPEQFKELRRNVKTSEELRRKLFMTPPGINCSPEISKRGSGRMPLGIVSNNIMTKPWKGLSDERRKLGLENTPPHPPPAYDGSQSCPGKLMGNRLKLDLNSSFII